MDLRQYFHKKKKEKKKRKEKKKSFPLCAKRENLSFYDFKCISRRIFVVNHNISSTITKAYWSSIIEDQEEELLRGPKDITVEGKLVVCFGTYKRESITKVL
jgi:hypothetical protein